MNRTRLVRTPVVDKNGKPTTVHKRADTGVNGAGSTLPAPALKPKRDPAQAYVEDAFDPCVDRLPPAEKQKLMATLHPETLPRMMEMKRRYPNMSMFNISLAINWSADNRNFAVFNSLMLLGSAADERDSEWYRNALHTLTGIEYISDPRNPIDFTNSDDPRLDGACELFDAIMKNKHDDYIIDDQMLPNHQTALTFYDPDVGSLIMEHPDRADEIVDLYRERKEYDPELFASVLGSSAPAINSGIL
jgi:hypothetical protein